MPSNDEPVRDAKKYKQCPVIMNYWSMKWSNINHASDDEPVEIEMINTDHA
jgi:hypothetical protein